MEPIYRQSYEITDIHVDCFNRLKSSVLLYFAQEAAAGHCMQLHTDWDTLAKQHLFWAITRHRVQISRLPMKGEKITVETWPMPTTRVAYPRSTVAYDEDGNELFRTIGLWVLMNTDTRSMILPGKSGVLVPGTIRGTELAVPGSLMPHPGKSSMHRTVSYTDLDINCHMNNTRYMDWVDDLMPSSFHRDHPVRELTVCYLSEAKEGQDLEVRWEVSDGPVMQVDAFRDKPDTPDAQERVFSARILF